MFGFWKRGERQRIVTEVRSLLQTLEHVGVHDAEIVERTEDGYGRVMPTAENVLLRQAEEIEAYRDMLSDRLVSNELAELKRENTKLRLRVAVLTLRDRGVTE